jgi:hypothetical protein
LLASVKSIEPSPPSSPNPMPASRCAARASHRKTPGAVALRRSAAAAALVQLIELGAHRS